MRSTVAVLAALTLASAAHAQPYYPQGQGRPPFLQQQAPRSLHDIPWYVAHPAARTVTLKLCRSDSRFSLDVDCVNASHADDQAWANKLAQQGDPAAYMRDPTYWATHRLQRIGTQAACATPQPMYPPATCRAVRMGAAMDSQQ